MKHQIQVDGETQTVALIGDIDLESSTQIREMLIDCVAQSQKVVVDLSGVTLIDSSGVASLLEALQSAKKKGKKLILSSVGNSVMRVLKLARLETVFTIEDSETGT